jgi:mono/diheme cytochrome c family protein
MKRVLKWAGFGVAGLVAVAALAAGGAFAASEIMIRMPQPKPASHVVAASDAGAVERGRVLAVRMGCLDCHGANLQGQMFDDIPGVARLIAPNLTLVAARGSDADLDRAIRAGVGADGRALWVMPSATFAHLSDAETADLIAFLRSHPPAGPAQPRLQVGPIGRVGALLGQFKPEVAAIKAHQNVALPDLGARYAEGRALARTCVECHGPTLGGVRGGPLNTPDLTIAAAYDPEDFARLMKTGVAAGGRELPLMSPTARARFSGFSPQEVAALQGYLKARADVAMKVAATNALPKP